MAKKEASKKSRKQTDDKDLSLEPFERSPEGLARRVSKFEGRKNAGKHSERDFSYTQNRELSWLQFNMRVLDEAFDPTVPLFERLKFVSIFASNLDEWFMIRIGGLSELATLKHQPRDNKSNLTPSEQLENIFKQLPEMLDRHEEAFHRTEAALAQEGLIRVTPATATEADITAMTRYFRQRLSPIISPLIVDPRHPFPNLRNGLLYVMCSLDGPDEKGLLGMVEVPPTLDRVISLSSGSQTSRYTLLEDVIIANLGECFGSYVPTSACIIRVTRNADIDPDGEGVEEEEDYRQHMKKVLKRRQRLEPVRLEMSSFAPFDESLTNFIRKELKLSRERVSHVEIPLDLSYVYDLEDLLPKRVASKLVFQPFEPQLSPLVEQGKPMRQQVMDHDILLFYPYESMSPLLDLLREASNDDDCISVKITLYRVAKQSRLCESLIAAAENGKDVTVLMELRARFDEANNIQWAERLESAGCTVIYGSEGFKCHSKICQITYHESGKISRITCLGTGNFNEKTARLYSDFMLLTSHEGIGNDGNAFFRNLSIGNLAGTYAYLGVAPTGLKPLIMRGIDREIARAQAGMPAQVFLKMNSLTDRDVIDKIAYASQAGVRVIMIIRGICCIRPGIKGITDNVHVHQIVGRLLEHSRVYAFGADVDTIYLSSADMMTRNTERRVEIAYPVLDPICRKMVISYMNLQLADNVKARILTQNGTWKRVERNEDDPAIDSQQLMIELAYRRSSNAISGRKAALYPISVVMPKLPQGGLHDLLVMSGSAETHPRLATEADPVVHETEDTDARVEITEAPLTQEVASDTAAETVSSPQSTEDITPVNESVVEQKASESVSSEASSNPDEVEEIVEPIIETVEIEGPVETHTNEPSDIEAIDLHHRGRFATAFALIGLGIKTLFRGTNNKQS
ncbi:MAG TPA: polyphosphate kinase 1 [Candidatus Coprovicinus avistercoris]|uniref:Polyphosphate kinase n=1 Tax=Candidatus Coprovicinus avistercoris TaxID=2840754 RepID=A0A9D1HW93_9ACTN|nr:polyphosphate kinase 1 [Candidatus Coprovicinus avistercoris]